MFSGHDPSKLYGFLAHCKMAFRSQLLRFMLKSACIIWAGLYLTDMVQQWFQRLIMEPEEPPTLYSWALFKEELHMYFGDPDKVATQEQKLHMLKMNDNHHVLHYINQFKEVVSLTKWNDNTLCSQFYQGLPSRLQDDILQEGKPTKLQGMYQAVLKFNGCYWERQEELKATRTSE
jgi:Retrotransposon gag protein